MAIRRTTGSLRVTRSVARRSDPCCDAFIAGYRPNPMPTAALNPTASATTAGLTGTDRLNCDATSFAVAMPAAMPIDPPATESTTDSVRNCARMVRPLAPSAMRRPISRVRSVTLTSMMFMMPMPPTSSDTPAIAASRMASAAVPVVIAPVISVRSRMEKSSSRRIDRDDGDRAAGR